MRKTMPTTTQPPNSLLKEITRWEATRRAGAPRRRAAAPTAAPGCVGNPQPTPQDTLTAHGSFARLYAWAADRTRPRRSKPTAAELLKTPDALLTRSHLRELGLDRRAIDAVFRHLPVIKLPDYSRPMIRVSDYLDLLDRCTYRDDRVRPAA